MMNNKLAVWCLVQGAIYCLVTLIWICYPQMLDIFNFSDTNFVDCDYKLAQTCSLLIAYIGTLYLQHGLVPLYNKYVIPKIFKGYSSSDDDISSLTPFSFISVINRLIGIPLAILIVQLTFGKGNTMIIVLTTIFVIVDPILAIITFFVIKKYGINESVTNNLEQDGL